MALDETTRAGTAKAWGLGFALLSSISFGASGPFGKALINAGLSPPQAVWLRLAGAALILLPIVLLMRRGCALPGRRLLPHLLAYGLAGVAGTQACYFVAISRLPVGVAVLLQFMGPVLVVLWIRFVRRAVVPPSAAVGVIVALVGLACVVEVWAGLHLDALGLAAGLGSATCMAAYFLIIDRLTGEADPLVMTAAGTIVAAIALGSVSAPWALPWHTLAETVPFGDGAAYGWTLAVWIILVSTVIGELTRVAAVQRLSAPVAGAIAYVEAVTAALIAWGALGERLTPAQITGGMILLAGAFIARRSVFTTVPEISGRHESAGGTAAEQSPDTPPPSLIAPPRDHSSTKRAVRPMND
jgi:drug/metabolite transporter (DMT)-like permease